MSARRDAALDYAIAGLRVFPVAGKLPRVAGWPKEATTDADTIRAWWTRWPDSNVGCAMGKASGLVALDVDGELGERSLDTLLDGTMLPGTPTSCTARGWHILFAWPGRAIANRVGVRPGLDVRGDGGFIVLPPSVHESGHVYAWKAGTERLAPAPMPAWLLALLERPARAHKANGAPARSVSLGSPWAEAAMRDECARVAGASAGTRNHTLNVAAFNLGGIVAGGGLERERVRAELMAAANACGLVDDDGEVAAARTIASGLEDGEAHPRAAGKVSTFAAPRPAADTARAGAPALADVLATFRRWLYLPGESGAAPLLVTLGAVAANLMPGDPVWLLVVAPPSSGKTETIDPLRALPGVHAAATLTEAALLSGSPKREHAKDARGGLLRVIGERGIILCKDFGSVLSMQRDARAGLLAALREVYDGSWTRHVGTDGGRTLAWQGHVGFIGGCPPTLDRHHGVMASLGERFLLVRLEASDADKSVARALDHAGHEDAMRKELGATLAAFFASLELSAPGPLDTDERHYLTALACLVARCRSSVERDAYSREIELVPGAESPARLAVTLKRLHDGLAAIGVGRADRWALVRRVALDSMPAVRRRALEAVCELGRPDTTAVAVAIAYPTITARRVLEDLAAYHVLDRETQGEGKAHRWTLADTFSEVSGYTVGDTGQRRTAPLLLPLPHVLLQNGEGPIWLDKSLQPTACVEKGTHPAPITESALASGVGP